MSDTSEYRQEQHERVQSNELPKGQEHRLHPQDKEQFNPRFELLANEAKHADKGEAKPDFGGASGPTRELKMPDGQLNKQSNMSECARTLAPFDRIDPDMSAKTLDPVVHWYIQGGEFSAGFQSDSRFHVPEDNANHPGRECHVLDKADTGSLPDGTPCRDTTNEAIDACVVNYAIRHTDREANPEYSFISNNCHDEIHKLEKACCLDPESVPHESWNKVIQAREEVRSLGQHFDALAAKASEGLAAFDAAVQSPQAVEAGNVFRSELVRLGGQIDAALANIKSAWEEIRQ